MKVLSVPGSAAATAAYEEPPTGVRFCAGAAAGCISAAFFLPRDSLSDSLPGVGVGAAGRVYVRGVPAEEYVFVMTAGCWAGCLVVERRATCWKRPMIWAERLSNCLATEAWNEASAEVTLDSSCRSMRFSVRSA